MERCPECHLPLHQGRERHFIYRFKEIDAVYRPHRCTALMPLARVRKLVPRQQR